MNSSNNSIDNIGDIGSEWPRLVLHVLSVCTMLVACVGCVTNAIIILVFLRHKEMRKLTHITCLWLLACVDLARCVHSISFQLFNLLASDAVTSWGTCAWLMAPAIYTSAVSFRFLALISFDRLLAILRPFKYRHKYNHRKRQLIAAAIVMLLTLSDPVLFISGADEPPEPTKPYCLEYDKYRPTTGVFTISFTTLRSTTLFSLITIIVLISSSVSLAVVHFRKHIHPLNQQRQTDASKSSVDTIEQMAAQRIRQRQKQMNKIILLTSGDAETSSKYNTFDVAFDQIISHSGAGTLLFVVPTLVWQLVRLTMPSYLNAATQFAGLAIVFNSSINMFIYVHRTDEFRIYVKKLLHMTKNSVQVSNNAVQLKTIDVKPNAEQLPPQA